MDTIRMARAMTAHAAQRAGIIAENVANADTPGFRSRDLRPFEDSYRNTGESAMRATRAGHFARPGWGGGNAQVVEERGQAAPNGNSVSLEDQMFKTAEMRRQHELSLTIYRSSLGLMRSAIARR
ncbi:MAG: FlgB family protein [Paracoccus sp. (in: a-proteobacteria)]|nr:FlgB family protein [Paracoccus sp. (in: a-proteobacteria)]